MSRALSAVTVMAMVFPVVHLGCAGTDRGAPVVTTPSQVRADALILVRGIT